MKKKEAQYIFISTSLSADHLQALLNILREFKDIFVWAYAKMHELDPQLGRCLNLINSWLCINSVVEKELGPSKRPQEISGQSTIYRFIRDSKIVEHWLANVVLTKKKMDRFVTASSFAT